MRYVLNAFSLNMVAPEGSIRWRPATTEEIAQRVLMVSGVGHPDTAKVMGVSFNRTTISLQSGDVALIGQYKGPRLPEGSTSLPEGSTIVWTMVEVN